MVSHTVRSSSGFSLGRGQKLAVLGAALAIAVLFRETLGFLLESWQRPEYSHGLLLPAISLFLLWQRWPQMRHRRFRTSWLGLPLVMLLLPGLLAARAGMPELAALAMVLTIAGTLLCVLGPLAFRLAITPLGLLLLAIPFPDALHAALAGWLQQASSSLGVALMRLAGGAVLLQDGVIDLGSQQISLHATSGSLKLLLPLVALAAVASLYMPARRWVRVTLVLSAVPIAVVMHGLHIGLIGILADAFGIDRMSGALARLDGWASFAACMALLIVEAWLLMRLSGEPRRLADVLDIDWAQHPPSVSSPAGATQAPRGRVLVVSSNFAPELTGIGKYVGEMSAWFAQAGFGVRVVTAPPYYPSWRVQQGFSSRQYMRHSHGGVQVIRCPLLVPRRPRGLTRIAHILSFAVSTLPVVLWQAVAWRPQIIFVVEPPLACAPAALLGARLCGARAWLHVQDFEVDAAFDLGLLKGEAIRNLASSAELWLMQRFDRVSSISPRMLRKLLYKGVDRARIEYFPNWVDTRAVCPGERDNPLRRELQIPGTIRVLLYSGNMGEKQGLDVLVEVAALLERTDPDVLLLLCGDGAAKKRTMDAAATLGNVRFAPLQPLARLNELLNLADVHLLPQRKDAEDLVMPSKLTAILASGRPVVASARPESDLGRAAAKGGIVVPSGDAEAFATALRRLLADPGLCEELGRSGRRYAMAEWDRETILHNAALKLDALLGGRVGEPETVRELATPATVD